MDKSLMQDLLQNTDDKVLAKLWNSFDDNESRRDSLRKVIQEGKNGSLEITISMTRIEPIELSDMIKKAIQDRPWIKELMTYNQYDAYMPELGDILQQHPNITSLRFVKGNIYGPDIINILKRNAITNLSFEGSTFNLSDLMFFFRGANEQGNIDAFNYFKCNYP
ncbi:MAG: hypothetical protein KF820_06955 [Candidatus Paracaedibacteraceae bacterium]|nr:hypothetical protein [Candidatus Paracaedibacteraceae bacterium]